MEKDNLKKGREAETNSARLAFSQTDEIQFHFLKHESERERPRKIGDGNGILQIRIFKHFRFR